MHKQSHLIVDVRPGDLLSISSGQNVSIELVKKSGQLARLRVSAPGDVAIERIGKECLEQNLQKKIA